MALRRHARFRVAPTALSAALLVATVLGPAAAAGENCPLVYGETQFPDAFDPLTTINNMPAIRISTLLFQGLVRVNEFREPEPGLASSWTLSTDRREIEFRLDGSARWHDGRPVTAEDVKFTVDLLKDRENDVSPHFRRKGKNIVQVSITAPDRFTCRFTEPTRGEEEALRHCRFPILPAHVLGESGLRRGGDFSTANPVGSGPYALDRVVVAENEVVLRANPHASPAPKIPSITMQRRANTELLTFGLTGGGLDFVANVSPDQIPIFARSVAFDVYPYESLSFEGIGFNMKNRHLGKRNIRRAMTIGCDRRAILSEVYAGQGTVLSGPFSPTSYCFCDTIPPDPYQPERARDLLGFEGYADRDGDSVLESPDNYALEFDLVVAAHDDASTDFIVAQKIAAYMMDLGIRIHVRKLTRADFEETVHWKKDFDLAFFAWAYDEGSNVGPLFITNDEFPQYDKNYISYDNPAFVEAYESWAGARDRIEAQSIGWRIHGILYEDAPYLFLWNLDKFAIASEKVAGVRIAGFSTFDYVERWERVCD